MPSGSASCKCDICGDSFTQSCDEINCEMLEERIDWYSKHHCICPSCFQKLKKREMLTTMEKIEELFPTLPTITGKSGNQIAYANSLRSRFMEKYLYLCLEVEEMAERNVAHLRRIIAKQDYPDFDGDYSVAEISSAYLCFCNSNADVLIEFIRNSCYI